MIKKGAKMRRKDREMGREFALKVIDNADFGVLSIVDEEQLPYGIPLSIVRDGDCLYFHSASGGKKVELFRDGASVHLVFVGEHKVPETMDKAEVEAISKDPKRFSLLTSKIFTTEFESAMVSGKIHKVMEDEQKIHALRLLCEKYTKQWMDYFPQAIESGLSITSIYAIEIEKVSGKRKKFDSAGVEMKWGRME